MPREMLDFEDFVRVVTPRLLRHAYSLCGDSHIAQDLVQEALLRMYERWAEVDPGRSPYAYAYRTVHNLHVNRAVRRSTAEIPLATFPELDGVPEPAETVQLKLEVARVLALLPAKERAVLVARYLNDLSVADTAASMGVSEAWVRTTSFRALGRLKAIESGARAKPATTTNPIAL